MNSDERALVDIALTAIYIPDIVSGKTKKDLFDDIGMQAALKYKIGVIGEAVKRLSKTFRDMHPSIPWKKIAGMRDYRDYVDHEYDNIDLDIVWHVVKNDVPTLLQYIEPLLPKEE